MKNKLVFAAVLALALGLVFASCDNGTTPSGDPPDNGTTGGGNKNAELVGTWRGGILTLTITETTFTMSLGDMDGPFTYDGTTLTFQDMPSFTIKVTKTSDTTLTISDYSSAYTDDFKEILEGTYTKQ
jgi:hypothetical protein